MEFKDFNALLEEKTSKLPASSLSIQTQLKSAEHQSWDMYMYGPMDMSGLHVHVHKI